jgi:hypothetical protein
MARKQKTLDFDIKPFDMKSIPDNKKILFLGKTNSGKSVLVIDYLYHHNDINVINVISPTEELNNTYGPHVPAAFIHDKYSEQLMENILLRQRKLVKLKKINPSLVNLDARAITIMDDCLADSDEWVNDKNIKWVFNNGRHAQMTFIITLQYPVGIPPKLRSDIQYMFLCRENSPQLQKKYYDLYGGGFPSFAMFQKTFLKCTEDRGCLVINNETLSSNISDSAFYYKVDINKPDWNTFKLGYKELWLYNDAIIRSKNEECLEKNENDLSKYQRPAIIFNVKKKKM